LRYILLPVASDLLPDLESERMAERALTKLIVEKIAPETGRDLFVWDSKVPGFGLRVYPSGKRMYCSSTAAGAGNSGE